MACETICTFFTFFLRFFSKSKKKHDFLRFFVARVFPNSDCRNLSATAPTRWRQRVKLADWRNDGCCVSVAELQNNNYWIYRPRHVSLHGHVAVQKYSQIANTLCRLDSISAVRKWITWDEVLLAVWSTPEYFRFGSISCKRLDAIHLSTSQMHTVTLFCRAWVSSGEQKPSVCHQRKDVEASRFSQKDQ